MVAAYLRLARPKQWVKNILVVAAPGAAGVLGEPSALASTAIAFVCFCLAASGTYFLNDALDAEADRNHPTKRNRPVAAGVVSRTSAFIGGALLVVAALALAFLARWPLAVVIGAYLAQTTLYSIWLKHEAVLDLACVASGFVLRAVAGGVAVPVPISPWFLIVTGAASLFMVTGKRHAELVDLGAEATEHRRALAGYSAAYLGYVRSVASTTAVVAYSLWAFEAAAGSGSALGFRLSIIPFVLAILRYGLLLERGGGGAPEDLVFSDRVLLGLGAIWLAVFALSVRGG
ncbi:MAG: decaprenyl-phosphate phosphoribosyltransferase [Actinomycetota bacterium]